MASQTELDLSCPVCQEVFRDPVVLMCSHSFCRTCLRTWWMDRAVHQCPVCKKVSFLDDPPSNLVLKNLCEAFFQNRQGKNSERLCSLHSERLKLFCVDHQELVCLVCSKSKSHDNHRIRPAAEAAADYKVDLQRSLKPLKNKLKQLEEAKKTLDDAGEHVKLQAESTERQIRETFGKIQQFLANEEEARISAVREEGQQKSRNIQEKIQALSRETAALSLTVTSAEEKLRAEDVSFLQHYKGVVKQAECCLLLDDPSLPSGALMDVSKHLGNLSFNIWNNMKDLVSYKPVILDPNTAHPELVLNEDLTAVKGDDEQKLPRNPERFQHHGIVLGSQGFSSGVHSWSVEVGDDPSWDIGVVEESVQRKGDIEGGCWEIGLSDGEYAAVAPPLIDDVISLEKNPEKIKVHLNWDEGTLSFFDSDTNTHIHTFQHKFTKKLFPFIFTKNVKAARILPLKVTVAVDGQTHLVNDSLPVSHHTLPRRPRPRLNQY